MNLTDFIAQVRYYTGFYDTDVQTDAVIIGFIRQMEEWCNAELRISDMIQIDTATVTSARVEVPTAWQENDFVRLVDSTPLLYLPRDNFYDGRVTTGHFTMSGRYLMVGGPPTVSEGKDIELTYFSDVPQLTSIATWLTTKFFNVALSGTLYYAFGGTTDDERAVKFGQDFTSRVGKLNDNYLRSVGKGSKLVRRIGSFG